MTLHRARFASRVDRGEVVYISSTLEGSPIGVLDDLPTAPMDFAVDSDFAPELPAPAPAVPGPVARAAPAPAPTPRGRQQDLPWGSGQPEGRSITVALRKLVWDHGRPRSLRESWQQFRRGDAADGVLELHESLFPSIARMRLHFRISHDHRGDSAAERDFVQRTLAAYLTTCLASSPDDELKRLKSRLHSNRGPWAKAQKAVHRALVHATRKAAHSGRKGEIEILRHLQRRAALDAIAQAFRQALCMDPALNGAPA